MFLTTHSVTSVYSTLNRFCFTANFPFWRVRFCRKLTLSVDQKRVARPEGFEPTTPSSGG
jgi:hypothetical protein